MGERHRLSRDVLQPILADPAGYECGFVSSWAVCRYFGVDVANLWEDLDIDQQDGAFIQDIRRVLVERGLAVRWVPLEQTSSGLRPSWEAIRQSLDQDRPVILMMRCGRRSSSSYHLVTVVAEQDRRLLLVDARSDEPAWKLVPRAVQLLAVSVGLGGRSVSEKQLNKLAKRVFDQDERLYPC